MRRSRVTSLDVASAANVSQATVSRAFAGGKVSVVVRERVFEVARRLNYQPNAVARSLTVGRSKLIAVVVSDQTSLIYPELVYELTEQLAVYGYHVMLFTTSTTRTTESVLADLLSHRVDGVISMTPLSQRNCEDLARVGLPVLLYNQTSGSQISSVYCDHQEAGRRLGDALVASGLVRVGVLAGPASSFVSAEFLAGLAQTLPRKGRRSDVIHGPYRYEFGQEGTEQLLEAGGQDAIVCVNDTVGAGCLDHLRIVRGLAVPNDIAVVALNGRGPSLWGAYAISAMRQPTERMAEAAVEALLARIDDPTRSPEHRIFFASYFTGKTANLDL